MAEVSLRKIVKRYDEVEAVRGIDLDIADHEFVVLVGPSGCGKSTTLRMIAGLEDITDGEIFIGGDVVNDVPPKDRDIAMVFQNYALYPHMTVEQNMSFGLRLKKYPKAEIRKRVDEAARHPGHQRATRPQAQAAVRRPAPACRHGPRHRAQPQGVPVRRAAVEPRRQAQGADAHRDQEGAPAGAHHHRLRHPRPDRGHDAGRPRRGHEPRHHRAGRHAEPALSQPEDALRRRLHRLAGHELHPLPGGGGERGLERAADRPADVPRFRPPAPRSIRATGRTASCCWGCGPSTSPRPATIWSPARCRSRPISRSPSRWAWRRWCISRSTARRCAAG